MVLRQPGKVIVACLISSLTLYGIEHPLSGAGGLTLIGRVARPVFLFLVVVTFGISIYLALRKKEPVAISIPAGLLGLALGLLGTIAFLFIGFGFGWISFSL